MSSGTKKRRPRVGAALGSWPSDIELLGLVGGNFRCSMFRDTPSPMRLGSVIRALYSLGLDLSIDGEFLGS